MDDEPYQGYQSAVMHRSVCAVAAAVFGSIITKAHAKASCIFDSSTVPLIFVPSGAALHFCRVHPGTALNDAARLCR